MTRQELEQELARQFRENQQDSVNWAIFVLALLWGRVRLDAIAASYSQVTPAASAVVVFAKQRAAVSAWLYMAQLAALEGMWFDLDGQRDRAGLPARSAEPESTPGYDIKPWTDTADDLPSGKTVREVMDNAPRGTLSAIKKGMEPAEALQKSLGRATQVAKTEPSRVARDILFDAAERPQPLMPPEPDPVMLDDYRKGPFERYRRIPSPGACDFCLMLASRGAIYLSRSSALVDKAGEPFHNNCRCSAAVETKKSLRYQVSIDPEDLRKVKTQSWEADLYWARLGGRDNPLYQYNVPRPKRLITISEVQAARAARAAQ